jgi:hypothetical protein
LCEKLKIYGFSETTRKWCRSFFTGRTQRVKIGAKMSEAVDFNTGVPQGSILSPVLFSIFVSDMEDWIEHSGVFTYADDLSTNASNSDVNEVIKRLEKDAEGILQYMASNGLVERSTRQSKEGKLKEKARTFVTDGARFWNRAPTSMTCAKAIWQAKRTIKEYFKTLPMLVFWISRKWVKCN